MVGRVSVHDRRSVFLKQRANTMSSHGKTQVTRNLYRAISLFSQSSDQIELHTNFRKLVLFKELRLQFLQYCLIGEIRDKNNNHITTDFFNQFDPAFADILKHLPARKNKILDSFFSFKKGTLFSKRTLEFIKLIYGGDKLKFEEEIQDYSLLKNLNYDYEFFLNNEINLINFDEIDIHESAFVKSDLSEVGLIQVCYNQAIEKVKTIFTNEAKLSTDHIRVNSQNEGHELNITEFNNINNLVFKINENSKIFKSVKASIEKSWIPFSTEYIKSIFYSPLSKINVCIKNLTSEIEFFENYAYLAVYLDCNKSAEENLNSIPEIYIHGVNEKLKLQVIRTLLFNMPKLFKIHEIMTSYILDRHNYLKNTIDTIDTMVGLDSISSKNKELLNNQKILLDKELNSLPQVEQQPEFLENPFKLIESFQFFKGQVIAIEESNVLNIEEIRRICSEIERENSIEKTKEYFRYFLTQKYLKLSPNDFKYLNLENCPDLLHDVQSGFIDYLKNITKIYCHVKTETEFEVQPYYLQNPISNIFMKNHNDMMTVFNNIGTVKNENLHYATHDYYSQILNLVNELHKENPILRDLKKFSSEIAFDNIDQYSKGFFILKSQALKQLKTLWPLLSELYIQNKIYLDELNDSKFNKNLEIILNKLFPNINYNETKKSEIFKLLELLVKSIQFYAISLDELSYLNYENSMQKIKETVATIKKAQQETLKRSRSDEWKKGLSQIEVVKFEKALTARIFNTRMLVKDPVEHEFNNQCSEFMNKFKDWNKLNDINYSVDEILIELEERKTVFYSIIKIAKKANLNLEEIEVFDTDINTLFESISEAQEINLHKLYFSKISNSMGKKIKDPHSQFRKLSNKYITWLKKLIANCNELSDKIKVKIKLESNSIQ